jgi:hypothetical protein
MVYGGSWRCSIGRVGLVTDCFGVADVIGGHLRRGQVLELFERRDVVVVATWRIPIHEFQEPRLQVLINAPDSFEKASRYCEIVATLDGIGSQEALSGRDLTLRGQPKVHPKRQVHKYECVRQGHALFNGLPRPPAVNNTTILRHYRTNALHDVLFGRRFPTGSPLDLVH